jgi:hypothetical protein
VVGQCLKINDVDRAVTVGVANDVDAGFDGQVCRGVIDLGSAKEADRAFDQSFGV